MLLIARALTVCGATRCWSPATAVAVALRRISIVAMMINSIYMLPSQFAPSFSEPQLLLDRAGVHVSQLRRILATQ